VTKHEAVHDSFLYVFHSGNTVSVTLAWLFSIVLARPIAIQIGRRRSNVHEDLDSETAFMLQATTQSLSPRLAGHVGSWLVTAGHGRLCQRVTTRIYCANNVAHTPRHLRLHGRISSSSRTSSLRASGRILAGEWCWSGSCESLEDPVDLFVGAGRSCLRLTPAQNATWCTWMVTVPFYCQVAQLRAPAISSPVCRLDVLALLRSRVDADRGSLALTPDPSSLALSDPGSRAEQQWHAVAHKQLYLAMSLVSKCTSKA
jgi:hypothetical protein